EVDGEVAAREAVLLVAAAERHLVRADGEVAAQQLDAAVAEGVAPDQVRRDEVVVDAQRIVDAEEESVARERMFLVDEGEQRRERRRRRDLPVLDRREPLAVDDRDPALPETRGEQLLPLRSERRVRRLVGHPLDRDLLVLDDGLLGSGRRLREDEGE